MRVASATATATAGPARSRRQGEPGRLSGFNKLRRPRAHAQRPSAATAAAAAGSSASRKTSRRRLGGLRRPRVPQQGELSLERGGGVEVPGARSGTAATAGGGGGGGPCSIAGATAAATTAGRRRRRLAAGGVGTSRTRL